MSSVGLQLRQSWPERGDQISHRFAGDAAMLGGSSPTCSFAFDAFDDLELLPDDALDDEGLVGIGKSVGGATG